MWEEIDKHVRDELAKPAVLATSSYGEALIRYLGEHGTIDDIDLLLKVAKNTSIEGYIRGTAVDSISRLRDQEKEKDEDD